MLFSFSDGVGRKFAVAFVFSIIRCFKVREAKRYVNVFNLRNQTQCKHCENNPLPGYLFIKKCTVLYCSYVTERNYYGDVMVHVSFKLMKSHLYTWLYLPMQIAEETTCSLVFLFDMRKRGQLTIYIENFNWLTFNHVEWNRNFSLKYGKSKASVNSGAPNGSVPQNICSSGQFLLAGRFGKNNMSLEVVLLGNFALWLYPNRPAMSVGKLAGCELFHQSCRKWGTYKCFPAISQNA